ncbi:tRNA threonylcarbamoyladenosine dehydratase isoform X2 [Selaginella moellendorffii]|uniref:tRNA threonylcarbamoyladenosine dehydratase isoform X2 n=1 Tax=Selaginella moellendorffii TaxID=88036 RepID=UPI000D1D10D8|nr:tRNA threonylcarbamoyladenosine dehydratase isoform X2 [Selaginella moellendorffii]|eukprot:XP_024533668.1 tRNA threonylcarbamoyladenosine dehydratase isoform X2 [Selaginella moellendorffii]
MDKALWLCAGAVFGSVACIAVNRYWDSFSDPKSREWIFFRRETKVTVALDTSKVDEEAILPDLSDEILVEQFTRNVQFFGLEGQKRVQASFVIVVGLGGVGSHAAAMLLRSGVGKLRLIDFDQVSLSSLNRHAVATRDDVGTPKAVCLKEHFSRIYPECVIEACSELFDESSAEDLLSGSPDFVLDCIDNIDTKVFLIATCNKKSLRVLSATGAGARADPTRVRIADVCESSIDPLSRAVRHRLRRLHGIESGVPVVFSMERPKAKLLPVNGVDGQEGNPSDYQIVPGFRVRIIPVLGTIPAIFGQVMASYTIAKLAGLQVETEPVVNLDVEHYAVLHRRLIEREELLYGTADAVEVDKEEVAYVVRELWRGKSARNQDSHDVGRGMWRSVNKLTLTRWDHKQPPSVSNLILLTFQEAEKHEASSVEEIKEQEPAFYAMVTETLNRGKKEF